MKIDIEDLSPIKKRLTVEVPAEVVSREIDEAYKTMKSDTEVSGFRKGKVPEKVLRQKFGERVKADVAVRLVQKTYFDVVKQKGLRPVEGPDIDLKSFDEEGGPLVFSATIEVTPEVDVIGYRDIKIEKAEVEVSEDEIETELAKLRERSGELKDLSRAAADGDVVIIDFEGKTADGGEISGGKAIDYGVIIGKNIMLPGFEQALIGLSAGDAKQVNATFPDDYHDMDLRGKDAVFNVTVKAVKERILPELDDEFAKDLDCDDMGALRKRLAEAIRKSRQSDETHRIRSGAIDRLIDLNPFDVPEPLVDSYMQPLINRVAENLKQGRYAAEDKGASKEELIKRYREIAVKQLKTDILFDAIAKKEDIEVTDEDIDVAVKDLALTRNLDPKALRGMLDKDGTLEYMKVELKKDKVFEFFGQPKLIVAP